MNLVGYTTTALSRNDIIDTPTNKNIVDGAIVELKDYDGNLVTIYDDINGTNPETQKTCDTDGQCTFFAEAGDYVLEVNGRPQNITISVNITVVNDVSSQRIWGDRYKGELTADAGVTLTDEFSVLLYDGNYYSYTGSDPFPVIVASGTVPATPDYKLRNPTDHDSDINRNAVGAHEASAISIGSDKSLGDFIAARNSFLLLENGADITSALQSISSTGGTIELGSGFEYTLSSEINFNVLPNIIGNNSTINITSTGSIKSDNNRSISTVAITQNQSKGDKQITVSDSSGFSVGDFFFIQNNEDFSFCGARSYYRDGDFCEITGIYGNVLTLRNGLELDITLDGGNPTKYQIHELNQQQVKWSNLKIIADDTSTLTPVVIDGLSLLFDNVKITGQNGNNAASLSAIYNCEFTNGCEFKNYKDEGGDGYGWAIRGGRFIKSFGSNFYSRRHGSSLTSGGAVLPTTPVRDIEFHGCTFDSFGNVNNTHAVDGHGASDRVYYYDCKSYAGVVMGGKNCYWLGGDIYSNEAQGGMYLREWVEGDFVFKPNKYIHRAGSSSMIGTHSSTETDSPYGDVTVTIDCEVENDVNGVGNFAVSLPWNTPDAIGLSVKIDKMNFKNDIPTDALVFILDQDAGLLSYVNSINVKESNFQGGARRWMRPLGSFINSGTRVSLPTVRIFDSINIPTTGKASKTIVSPVRYPFSNIAINVSFYDVAESGVVAGSSSPALSGSGYYYYSSVTGVELTGDFTATNETNCVVEYVVDNINPVE